MGLDSSFDRGRRQPIRLLEWRDEDDGTVTVLRPKYGPSRFGRWLSSRLSNPYCGLKLDEYGSFVWKRCDGNSTIAEIAHALRERSADGADDLDTRLAIFVRSLERSGMIGWAGSEADGRI